MTNTLTRLTDARGRTVCLGDEIQTDELGPEWRSCIELRWNEAVVMLEWQATPGIETPPVESGPRPYAVKIKSCVSRPRQAVMGLVHFKSSVHGLSVCGHGGVGVDAGLRSTSLEAVTCQACLAHVATWRGGAGSISDGPGPHVTAASPGARTVLVKTISWFGRDVSLACDGRCDKAFGINGRPKTYLGDDPDDYVYLGDDAIGMAPGPGETVIMTEGSSLKPSAGPLTDATKMNKWCARECERSTMAEEGEAIRLPDLQNPTPNMRPRSPS
jgi:hypothetical protein